MLKIDVLCPEMQESNEKQEEELKKKIELFKRYQEQLQLEIVEIDMEK